MATINLLPWRAERRRQRERDFYTMLAAAAVSAVLAWLLWGYWMGVRIDNQDARNNYLKDEIHQLDGKLTEIKELEATKGRLLARKQIIEQLQASRSMMVHLFDELVKTVPEGVRLTSLKQNADTLTLLGVAQANGNVATYMRNLDASPWLKSSDLQRTEAKGTDQRNRYEFGLTVKMRSPDQPGSSAAPAPGIGPGTKVPASISPPPAATPAGAKP
jgi:type IV pilus assembly protein PilN